MKLFIQLAFLLAITLFVFPVKSFADSSCQPIYGGGQTCITSSNILIDKKVLNPSTNTFVDNLGINDPKYKPDFIVYFQINLINTSDKTLSKIAVRDTFPQYITFNAGLGNFDNKTRTLSFNADDLKPNESKTYTIIGRVAAKDKLPQEIICVVNQAIATTDNNQTSQDNTQFCIENAAATKGGFPVLSPSPMKQTPATGPEAMALFAMIPTGIAGFVLRKFSFKNRKEKN